MRILIATVKIPFIRGGAEILAESLEAALLAAGHDTEIVQVPFKWYPADRTLDHMLACRFLDLTESSGIKVDLLIGLKFPAYYIRHPNKVLWLIHQHRQAYDMWNDPIAGGLVRDPNGMEVRDAILGADQKLIPEAKAVYTISKNVSGRLMRFCGLKSTPLYHPPPGEEELICREFQDYFFFPSRLTPTKRQSLVVEALAETRNPVKVCFAGVGDSPDYMKQMKTTASKMGLDHRIEWAGGIGNEEKIQRYARCLGVIYPPLDEDYGYVTLESMISSKPVITCTDSGGPNEFVDNTTGFVADPTAASLAQALDTLWENRDMARHMGKLARDRYFSMDITWAQVVRRLLE